MKKTAIIFSMLVSFSFVLQAQTAKHFDGNKLPVLQQPSRVAKEADGLFSTNGMSTYTAFLLADMMVKDKHPEAFNEKEFIKKYSLTSKGNILYANSFIKGTTDFQIANLKNYGVIPGTKSGNIYTGLIPIDQIANVAKAPMVTYVAIGTPATLFMDSARIQTHVNEVHQGLAPLAMPYKGDGVVIGDIDIGFDYTHPNFYDSTGINNYRIKRVWQQVDASGTPPTGYSYGSEYTTQTAILNQKTDDTSESHGSHVMGIAAGSGGYLNSPYVGVAPHADIVMVGGDISSDARVVDAINYIQSYATSVNKPSVINMSFGSNMGPHDGNSIFDQDIAGLIGPGKLLVSAVGNDGNVPNYLGHTFTTTDTIINSVALFSDTSLGNIGTGYVDIWGNPNENFSISIGLFNAVTNQIEDQTPFQLPANISTVIYDTLHGVNNVAVPLKFAAGIQTQVGNKPEILLNIDKSIPRDSERIIIITISGNNASFKMWGEEASTVAFSNGTTDHTVADLGGTSNSTIGVGAYVSKNKWTDIINNFPIDYSMYVPIHDIASFSAKGPTADGRTKPDITAPGMFIASSLNSYNEGYLSPGLPASYVDKIISGGHTWYFGIDQGTSMAAPMVTGILALWLQQNPNLTRAQAIALMKSTAITDSYTGAIPVNGSNTWGWGKINAFSGLVKLGVENVSIKNSDLKVYPNPTNNQINIAFSQSATATEIVLYDMSGKIVFEKHLSKISSGQIETINTYQFANGIYALKISNGKEVNSYKINKQ